MAVNEAVKSERFREAATRRVRNVETTLRRVRNLSNPVSYSYTEEEIEHIFEHLQKLLDLTRESFATPGERPGFTL